MSIIVTVLLLTAAMLGVGGCGRLDSTAEVSVYTLSMSQLRCVAEMIRDGRYPAPEPLDNATKTMRAQKALLDECGIKYS